MSSSSRAIAAPAVPRQQPVPAINLGPARSPSACRQDRQRQLARSNPGEPDWMRRVLDETWRLLPLAPYYDFPKDDQECGTTAHAPNAHALRCARADRLGVVVLDHSGALEPGLPMPMARSPPVSAPAGRHALAYRGRGSGGHFFRCSHLLVRATQHHGDGYLMAARRPAPSTFGHGVHGRLHGCAYNAMTRTMSMPSPIISAWRQIERVGPAE